MSGFPVLKLAVAFGDLAVKSALVLLLAWMVVLLMRKCAAATRHLVWLSAFSIVLLVPVLTLIVPSRQLAIFKISEPVQTVAQMQELKTESTVVNVVRSAKADPVTSLATSESPSPGPAFTVPDLPASGQVSKPAAFDWSLLSSVALGLWLLGVFAVAMQGMWGFRALQSLLSKGTKPKSLDPAFVDLTGLSGKAGLKRGWDLRISEGNQPPAAMTWGLFRPVVLLPKESDSWSQERLEAVLLHELAHVRRFDYVSQLTAVAASTLYWFNPIVWLCARAMRAEAETAADDTVIRMGIKPSDYAQELLRIAAGLGSRRQPFTNIGVPVMKKSKIESRVKAILDPAARRRRGVTLVEALATVGLSAVLAIPLSSLRAAVVPNDLAVLHEPNVVFGAQASPPNTGSGSIAAKNLIAISNALRQSASTEDEKKIAAEVKALRAEEAKIRAELAQARAELAQTKAQLRAQLKAHAGADSQRQMAMAREQMLKAQQDMARSLTGSQKEEMARQRAELERQMSEMKREMAGSREQMMKAQQDAGRAQKEAMKAQLEEMRQRMEMARDQLRKAKDDAGRNQRGDERAMKIEQLRKLLELDKVRVQSAKQRMERMRTLHSQGFIASPELDEAEASYNEAKAQLEVAEANLMTASKN